MVSTVELEEFVDANGGFERVDKGDKWAGIAYELGLGEEMAPEIRSTYLRLVRRQTWADPTESEVHSPASKSSAAVSTNRPAPKYVSGKRSNGDRDKANPTITHFTH